MKTFLIIIFTIVATSFISTQYNLTFPFPTPETPSPIPSQPPFLPYKSPELPQIKPEIIPENPIPIIPENPIPIIPEPDELNIYDVELSVFELINRERIKVSAPTLIWKKYSHAKAREHSEYMAKTGDFEHSALNFYENIFMITISGNTDLPYEAVNSWMNSPGHKSNLLTKDIKAAGIGIAISNQGRAYITYMAD